jgi:hypothetical protein
MYGLFLVWGGFFVGGSLFPLLNIVYFRRGCIMIKKAVFTVLVASLFLVFFTSLTFAYSVQLVDGSGYGIYQAGVGGEFTLKPDASLSGVLNLYDDKAKNVSSTQGTFQSFCLEKNEYINAYGRYDVSLETAAIGGGFGGGHPDPLSQGSAYLYYEFAKGTLAGYDYLGTEAERETSASLLQEAFWALEDEIGAPAGNMFYQAALDEFGDYAKWDNEGLYPVMVMNLWAQGHIYGCGEYAKQSQMVLTTPIPGAIYLLGAGLMGLVGIRRRMAA